MKKRTRNISIAALLISSIIITSSTALIYNTKSNKTVSQPTTKVSSSGVLEPKEIEAFADPIFAEKMKKYNVNGSNFVVVKDGKVLVNKGYGYADKEKKTLVDKDTVFQIASVSKTFTALAALQLVEQGKIDLNHDINEYLGGMIVPNKTNKPLTMYDMLTYTTGFDYPDKALYVDPEYVNQDIPMKEFMTEHMPTVVRTPGEAYTYDNFAFLLAGFAIQTVSSMPFQQYMEKNVFKPLGMNSTSVRFTPELLSRMATNYDPDGKPHKAFGNAPTDGGQGSILSTGEDMAKYLIMFQQQGTVGGKEIISKKTTEQMQTYSVFADKSIPMTTVGGFEGYRNDLMNGHHVVLKGGNMPGHQSLVVLLPEQNTAFYMSYNNDSMMSLEVYGALMDHYFPDERTPEKTTYIPLSESDSTKYVGSYQNTRFYFLKSNFTYAEGNLLMETGTSGKHTLKMINPLLFEDESGNKLAFKKDHKDQIEYFYYTNPNSLDYGSDARKVHPKPAFADVPNDSVYITYITNLHSFNVISAKSGNLFEPLDTMTQGEFMDVAILAHGWATFNDYLEDNKEKIVSGVPGFDRNAPITRQIAAVMIQNLKQAKPATDIKLTGDTDSWAVNSITALVSQGIVDPDTKVKVDGSVDFRSKQPLLRQEASALLDLAFGYYTLPIKSK
ncbi:serine hydrolase [Paenibacillus macquariensis]|uniref:CubicO group peptidase, beta-lactamase class C family n=1 Tax=Paenibacillus macquariensis TaxID=948756 RepID=A0ABY1JUG0_9BACL|nr:serine hydrolase [Paenibacillus macquariensis]MEC0090989.1 serine hydrolase [Paenibacillus macquariensis]OAB34708.1 penicillin-binding protein [Paenibacillus macquariensis subsp. macquariensis]SIQ79216.1 CubicO group peptidase, beta-lactamase class C family [Paenibacillus macquariensis]